MNNPFGIPDDVFEGMVASILKAQGKTRPGNNANIQNPFIQKVEFNVAEEAKKSASVSMALYKAYQEVGFTQEQAFELVNGILTAKKN